MAIGMSSNYNFIDITTVFNKILRIYASSCEKGEPIYCGTQEEVFFLDCAAATATVTAASSEGSIRMKAEKINTTKNGPRCVRQYLINTVFILLICFEWKPHNII